MNNVSNLKLSLVLELNFSKFVLNKYVHGLQETRMGQKTEIDCVGFSLFTASSTGLKQHQLIQINNDLFWPRHYKSLKELTEYETIFIFPKTIKH